MSDIIHVSNEIDRQAHQAISNIVSLKRYQNQRALLDQKKDELALQVTQQFPHASIHNIKNAIRYSQQYLEKGATFKEALGYARNLLNITRA